MKKYVALFLALLGLGVGVVAATAETQQARFLFVQSADSIAFDNNVLTLKNVSPATVFFSDRPKRIAGHMATSTFVDSWSEGRNSFKKTPPNATLSVLEKTKAAEAVVELSDPKLDGKNLSFKVTVLSGEIPKAGGNASLFIDAGDGGCWAGYEYENLPCWQSQAFSAEGN